MACHGVHKKRLFVGEGNFTGVFSLLEKNKDRHPDLGKSITATELKSFGDCEDCQKKLELAQMVLATQKFLISDEEESQEISTLDNKEESQEISKDEKTYCTVCPPILTRIESLKERGVTIILGYDGTKMHEHPETKGKRFRSIHWICPHDGSNYKNQTLPPLVKNFFKSCTEMQEAGDRVYVTLAQPTDPAFLDKPAFYQGVVYNIVDAAASNRYALFKKRPFSSTRYPGYEHTQTKGTQLDKVDTMKKFIMKEFIFKKIDHEPLENNQTLRSYAKALQDKIPKKGKRCVSVCMPSLPYNVNNNSTWRLYYTYQNESGSFTDPYSSTDSDLSESDNEEKTE